MSCQLFVKQINFFNADNQISTYFHEYFESYLKKQKNDKINKNEKDDKKCMSEWEI